MVSKKLAEQPISLAAIVDALAPGACAVDHANRIVHANARWNPSLSSLPAVTQCFAVARREGRAESIVDLGAERGRIAAGVLDADGTLLVTFQPATADAGLREERYRAARVDSLGTLAAGISHDFNNLLTVIRASLSEAVAVAGPEAAPLLRTAAEATENATELAQQLVDMGRSTGAGRKPVPIEPLVRDLFGLLRRTTDPNVELIARVEPGTAAMASPSQIHQVLFNLALNGIEAMPGGGRLQIACAPAAEAELPDELAPRPHGYVRLACSDTGHGMDPATLDRVFEPYFSTKGDSGNGLGLAMVSGIVRDHGGVIEARSAVGRGTSMVVYLPAAAPGAAAEHPDAPPAPKAQMAPQHLVALVVDDREELRTICSAVMRRAGFGVLEAGSGEEALRVVAQTGSEPDIALVDAAMPGMSGRETVDHLRERYPALKVLLMSGFAPATIQGFDPERMSFLQKPFDSDALLASVQQALDRD